MRLDSSVDVTYVALRRRRLRRRDRFGRGRGRAPTCPCCRRRAASTRPATAARWPRGSGRLASPHRRSRPRPRSPAARRASTRGRDACVPARSRGPPAPGPRTDAGCASTRAASAQPLGLAHRRRELGVLAEAGKGRLDHHAIEMLHHLPPRLLLPAPPRRHRRHPQLFAEHLAAEARQERHQCRRFHQAAAEAVGDVDVAGARGLHQAGHAQQRVAAQLQRIAEARRPAVAGSRPPGSAPPASSGTRGRRAR